VQLLFDNATFLYRPYPIGLAKPIFREKYEDFVKAFPGDDYLRNFPFQLKAGGYKKFALNEAQGKHYHEFLEANPLWYAFYLSIKQPHFPEFIFSMLKAHHIEVPGSQDPTAKWSTRFEFAGMPADGGYIAPHNDVPTKLVTLIFSMQTGGWNPAWGGGTDVLVPLEGVEPSSYKTPLDQFKTVASFPYEPNQCVIFVRSEHSWHSVGPMTGPKYAPMRRTITLNIEKPG
jgi:hypothetical protein